MFNSEFSSGGGGARHFPIRGLGLPLLLRVIASPLGVASAQMQSQVWFKIGQLSSVVKWIQNSVVNVSMHNL
jgi:hypothetical protein